MLERSAAVKERVRVGPRTQKARDRAERGLCLEDVWSFDGYLAAVIAEGCRELARVSHGAPTALYEDQEHHTDTAAAMEKWREILTTIAEGFERYAESDLTSPEFERAFDLLREWWGALWD